MDFMNEETFSLELKRSFQIEARELLEAAETAFL